MKEETPPIKNLPPKKSGGGSNMVITPTKASSDEILSTLLRLNNHDSFSSIKDESLDIDLSACVTINTGDSAPVLNGNSFSSTDFWRMLDENAQATQLELACTSDESMSKMSDTTQESSANCSSNIKELNAMKMFEIPFGDKFVRPNPPTAISSSALRKTPVKLATQTFENIDHKILSGIPKDLTITRIDRPTIIKLEPIDQLPDILIEEDKLQEKQNHMQQPMKTNNEPVIQTEQTAEPLHKCMTCNGMLLRKPQELTTHELASHRIIHVCSLCEREFEQEAGLKKHLKSHRTVDARKDSWRKCPDCGKCLKLGSMWMHRKIHSDNKKYACDICGQKFVQKINLTHHSRVHTAEKPYECPECQKRFQERSHLQRHQKYHAQTRSYRCEKCGKMYKTERCLKVHNLVHLEQRPFACNVCDKSFISNSKLKQHSNIHTGERPFKCNYCPRDFTNFPNWLKHTRRRHKVDHKTGQQLENIPSYCSKKSTKTPKPAKTAGNDEQLQAAKPKASNNNAAVKTIKNTLTTNITQSTMTLTDLTKLNQQMTNSASTISVAGQFIKTQPSPSSTTTKMEQSKATTTTITTTIANDSANTMLPANNKPVKAKRERKQPMPRQVQKAPKMSTIPIKQEHVMDSHPRKVKTTQTDFPDLHGLSLTSAEELIMEQALEMEECGLYDAPISSIVDTDNAISAEAAAALQYKIKSEYIESIEEVGLKDPNKRLCSSLESSPYSSPASIDLPAATNANNTITINKLSISPTNLLQTDLMPPPPLTTFYMQPFQLNSAQNSMLTRLCNNNVGMNATSSTTTTASALTIATAASTSISTSTTTTQSSPIQLIPTTMLQQQQQPQTQSGQIHDITLPTTQAFLNHFFLPMTVNMQQTKLPSVETLLFSAHANASLFQTDLGSNSSNSTTPTTQQPPPPSLTTQQHNLS